MLCPVCGEDTRVIESRKNCEAVYRLRECKSCKYGFYTSEYEMEDSEQGLKALLLERNRRHREKKRKEKQNEENI